MCKKRPIGFLIINIALVAAFITCLCIFGWLGSLLESQQAAERWAGESGDKYTQVTCMMPVGGEASLETIQTFRDSLPKKFKEASIEAEDGGSLWIDAYNAEGTLTLTSERGSYSAKAIGVGGNFFFFHPLKLLSGSYIAEDDLSQDRIVLDNIMAWKLFGSYDVAGMEVSIDNVPFIVAGVVEREDDFATSAAASDESCVYLQYSVLAQKVEKLGASCYEAVLPDPIKGYGKSIADEFPVGDGEIIVNSSRFSLDSIITVALSYGKRSMQKVGVAYPYWENASRAVEDWMALVLVCAAIFALCPAVSFIILVVIGWKRLSARIRSTYKHISQEGIRVFPSRKKHVEMMPDALEKVAEGMKEGRFEDEEVLSEEELSLKK